MDLACYCQVNDTWSRETIKWIKGMLTALLVFLILLNINVVTVQNRIDKSVVYHRQK